MKQKTAMMELIEWLNKNGMSPDIGIPAIKDKANQLLEKEKEQMINVYTEGTYCDYLSGEEYYEEYYLEKSKQ